MSQTATPAKQAKTPPQLPRIETHERPSCIASRSRTSSRVKVSRQLQVPTAAAGSVTTFMQILQSRQRDVWDSREVRDLRTFRDRRQRSPAEPRRHPLPGPSPRENAPAGSAPRVRRTPLGLRDPIARPALPPIPILRPSWREILAAHRKTPAVVSHSHSTRSLRCESSFIAIWPRICGSANQWPRHDDAPCRFQAFPPMTSSIRVP